MKPPVPSVPPEETKIQAFGRQEPSHRQPRVRWSDGTGTHSVVLREKKLVGSAPTAGLVIADPAVSRIHAELDPRPDGTWIQDLGSRNGTFVNGIFVNIARVPDGGKIQIGATDLILEFTASEDPVELWPNATFGPVLGTSRQMRELFAYLARISPSDSPVLIQGETGTGKELVAHAIHQASPRASGPFVIVDCAALPEHLIESELFGHAKGAFTGADRARTGAIEAADGGTVFLDEIGELPLALQPHLLRVLESGTIRRVGETSREKVNVRFLSATHRDLRTMVNAGAFREDLYFRLAVLPVSMPALRERKEDIPQLVQSFLPKGMLASPEILRELNKRPWLGNVRELRNFVHRAMAVGAQEALRMSADPEGRSDGSPSRGKLPTTPEVSAISFVGDFKTFRENWIDLGEKEYLQRLLARHNRNVAAAAREAELDRTYIYRLIRQHAL